MTIRIIENHTGSPAGKLADAELHFTDSTSSLAGMKLIGFAIWERRSGAGRNVTFPARQYSVNGERRSFALLRPTVDTAGQDRLRDLILSAYARHMAGADEMEAAQAAAAALAARAGVAQPLPDDGSVDPDGFQWAPDTAPVTHSTRENSGADARRAYTTTTTTPDTDPIF